MMKYQKSTMQSASIDPKTRQHVLLFFVEIASASAPGGYRHVVSKNSTINEVMQDCTKH